MKVKLSDQDRAVIATAQRQIPWQGVEDVIVARYELSRALQLQELERTTKGKPFEKLSRAPSFIASLTPPQLELLISIASGGGQAIAGEVGPRLGELVSRLRAYAPRMPPKKEE